MQKRKLTDNNINKECWTSVEYIAIDFLCKHGAAALTPSSTKYCHNHINTRTQNTRIQIFEKASGSAALALSHSCHPAMDNIFGSYMLVFRSSNMIFQGGGNVYVWLVSTHVFNSASTRVCAHCLLNASILLCWTRSLYIFLQFVKEA